jgi:hypothetical protein
MTKQEFQQELETVGCAHSWDGAGDFEVLMPLLIHALGREEFLRRVMEAREEVLFNPSVRDAWQSSIQYIAAWADNEIARFRQRKLEEQQRRDQRNP